MNRLSVLFHRNTNNTNRVVPDSSNMYEAENNDDSSAENDDDIYEDDERTKSQSVTQLMNLLPRYNFINRVLNNLSYNGLKSATRWLLDTASLNISIKLDDILVLLTIFILFDEDIKVLATGRSVDTYFSTANAVCFFFFCGELVANTWSKTMIISFYPFKWQGFLFSFFFWTDFLSILSIIPDISWMAGPIGIGNIDDQVVGNSNYSKAARVIRLVRLVRIVRLYRSITERETKLSRQRDLWELYEMNVITYEKLEKNLELYTDRQSRLGAQLSDSITRRVIIIILIMVIVIPLLTFSPSSEAPDFILDTFNIINTHSYLNDTTKKVFIEKTLDVIGNVYNDRYISYLYLDNYQSNPIVDYSSTLNYIRDGSKQKEHSHNRIYLNNGTTASSQYAYTDIIIDNNYLLRKNAEYSIILTILIGFILVVGSHIFTSDAHLLVIEPIDRMMNLVEAVAKNPLRKYEFDDKTKKYHNEQGEYETKLLESTISKITGLLRVGFGEAGANIISTNLTSSDSSTTINPLVPGVRVYAIFGFCDILQFEAINQRLQLDVLTFVNHIAEIVHSRVHSWNGQCNKNLGNAFVIVWRIGDEEAIVSSLNNNRLNNRKIEEKKIINKTRRGSSTIDGEINIDSAPKKEKKGHNIDLRRVPGVDVLADKALIAYLKIIAEINRSKEILKYRVETRLTLQGSEEFKVRMGFGLHAGWAIEGAVGSIQKVDATYLSPHVNMAARLETSSRQYGVPLLMSQNFYDIMSVDAKKYCRKLDVVTVKGSEVPIAIYTYDANQEQDFYVDGKKRRSSINSLNTIIQSAQILNEIVETENENENDNGTARANTQANAQSNILNTNINPTPQSTDPPISPLFNRNNALSNSLDQTDSQKSSGKHRAQTKSVDLNDRVTARVTTRDGKESENNTSRYVGSMRVSPHKGTMFQGGTNNGTNTPTTVKFFYTSSDDTSDTFEKDRDLVQLRSHITPDFLLEFNEGISLYISGDWNQAKIKLEKANDVFKRVNPLIIKGDGPSNTIIKYIEAHGLVAPKDWKGFRPLTSK